MFRRMILLLLIVISTCGNSFFIKLRGHECYINVWQFLLREAVAKLVMIEMHGQVEELFQDLVLAGLQPTAATYNTLVASHCSAGSWVKAITLLTHMLQHVSPAGGPFETTRIG